MKKQIFAIAIAGCLLISCNSKIKPITWTQSKSDIVGTTIKSADDLSIDIYIDATGSMGGFASKGPTNYTKFLDQLETTCITEWKKADVKYFKFGRRVKPLSDRSDFLKAKDDPNFYKESGLFDQTNIDSAIAKADPNRVTVLVTDLFYRAGDINAVTLSLQKLLSHDLQIGILGMESVFDGYVADIQPPISFKSSARPFYAVIIGDQVNIEKLYGALAYNDFIVKDHFLLITKYPIADYDVNVTKLPTSKAITKKSKSENEKELALLFPFYIREKATQGEFQYTINLKRRPYVPDLLKDEIKGSAFKRIEGTDSTESNDLRISVDSVSDNTLKGKINYQGSETKPHYSYAVYLKQSKFDVRTLPKWIDFYSADVVDKDQNKDRTLNFRKLVQSLCTYNLTINSPPISKFYINLYKN
jgi:hypothetical protein